MTVTLGDLLDQAQFDALNALSLVRDYTGGRLQKIAAEHYSAVLVSDPIARIAVLDFIVDFGATFPGAADAFARYAALRDAWTAVAATGAPA